MQIFSSRKRKLEAFIMLSSIFLVGFYGYRKFSTTVPTDPESLAALLGPYGPAGIFAAQFVQVMIAPVPPVTPVVSGMIYGTALGTFYSFIGAAAGSLVAIVIARKFGRSAAEKFLSEEGMEKFDKYTSGHGYLPFIVLFTFPGFPDDALCFIAGLTTLDWKRLFLIASIGRIPGIALLAFTGGSAAQAKTLHLLASGSALLVISLLSVRYEEKLEEIVAELEKETLAISPF